MLSVLSSLWLAFYHLSNSPTRLYKICKPAPRLSQPSGGVSDLWRWIAMKVRLSQWLPSQSFQPIKRFVSGRNSFTNLLPTSISYTRYSVMRDFEIPKYRVECHHMVGAFRMLVSKHPMSSGTSGYCLFSRVILSYPRREFSTHFILGFIIFCQDWKSTNPSQ